MEKELRNKEAQALEAEIAIQKRREKESILDELVISQCIGTKQSLLFGEIVSGENSLLRKDFFSHGVYCT